MWRVFEEIGGVNIFLNIFPPILPQSVGNTGNDQHKILKLFLMVSLERI